MPTRLRRFLAVTLAVPTACLLVVAGCDDDTSSNGGVRVYSAPKDPPPAVRVRPIDWTLPTGWEEIPDSGNSQFGTFAKIQVSEDDPSTVLSVNQISSGDMLSNLNRWEGQLGLSPTPAAELASKVKVLPIAGHDAFRFDLTGKTKEGMPERMLGVLLPEGGGAWSFLLKGAPDKVAGQSARFDAFVGSVHFPGHEHEAAASASDNAGAASTEPTSQPAVDDKHYAMTKFTVPSGWAKDPTERMMRTATFYAGTGNDRAELIVVKLPLNRFGTMLMNINRWRREVGLPESTDEHQENVSEAKVTGAQTLLFDFAGPEKRSLVAMLVKGGDVWFFKLIGPAKTVGEQRTNFDAFLQSLQFGEAAGE